MAQGKRVIGRLGGLGDWVRRVINRDEFPMSLLHAVTTHRSTDIRY